MIIPLNIWTTQVRKTLSLHTKKSCKNTKHFHLSTIPDPDPDQHDCNPCPLGASCKGYIAWGNVTALHGWWRLHDAAAIPPQCLVQGSTTTTPPCAFEKCLYPHACHGAKNPELNNNGGNVVDRVEQCDEANGYSNSCTDEKGNYVRCRLCGTCIGTGLTTYKRSGTSTKCKQSFKQVAKLYSFNCCHHNSNY